MDFSKAEKKMILKARKAIKSYKIKIAIVFILWAASLIVCLIGYFDFKFWLYPSLAFFLLQSIFPGVRSGPKYIGLVDLLERKLPQKDAIDTIVDAYKEAQKI